MILASLFLSSAAALVKWVSPRIPIFEIILFRCLVPVPLLAWLLGRRGIPIMARNRRLMLIRSLLGITAMALYFWALEHLPIADTLLIMRIQPVVVAALAPLLLAERPGRVTLLCILLSLGGAALILQPALDVGNIAGVAAFASALFSAGAHITVRRQSAHDDPMVIVFNFTAITALIALPLTAADPVLPSMPDTLALLAIAVLATIGQLFLTGAYAVEEAPVVAAATYMAVVFGILLGALIWHELPMPPVWVGGALVVGAGLILLASRRRHPGGAFPSPPSSDPAT